MTIHPLADRLEYHEESSNGQAAKDIGGAFLELGDVTLVYSHPDFGTGLNFACRIRSEDTLIESMIDDVNAWFTQRNIAPHFRVSPLTRPANVAAILEQRGFVRTEAETQMVLETDDVERSTNRQVRIETVTLDDLEQWVSIQHRGFGGSSQPSTSIIEMARRSYDSGRSTLYVARLYGEAVGAASLINWAGVFGIYGVAVEERVRGQGVGTALARRMIRDARVYPDMPICLQVETSSPTQSWYERLGFRVVYDRTGWTKK
ncbi:MAG: GNAT family N-acetyltransferase [Chloroflexi bacterium]|nr:GNAT family N-acetyltransferase [Chloroflexota bacterium]